MEESKKKTPTESGDITDSTYFVQKGYLSGDFRIFYLKDTMGTETNYHYHPFHKITVFLSGDISYFVAGKQYRPGPMDIILAARNTIHRIEVNRSVVYERIVLYLSPSFLEKYSFDQDNLSECFFKAARQQSYMLRRHAKGGDRLSSSVRELKTALSENGYGASLKKHLACLSFLLELNRAFVHTDVHFPDSTGQSRIVSNVIHLIDKNLTGQLCVNWLAQQSYVSKYHLMRLFKKETGFTLSEYITERRLLAAKELLLSGKSATQACFMCGFSTYSTFYRAYKEHFHHTPKEEKADCWQAES